MNNTDNVTLNRTAPIDLFSVIVGFYLYNLLLAFGALFNLICILIFIKIIKQEQGNQGHLYKYLLLKSIFDCLFCINTLPQIFYYGPDSSINESYIMQVWFSYCYYYVYFVLSQTSVWFEIIASIDCLCLISKRFQRHKTKRCFWIVTISLIVVINLYYISDLFWFKIEKNSNGGYFPAVTSYGKSKFKYYHLLLHNILRDILPVFISFILNIMIVRFIRQLTVRRVIMAATSVCTITNQTSLMIKKSQKAEKNKIKMMFFTSFIHIFHLPVIFWNFNIFNVRANIFTAQLCLLSFTISYSAPIITYITFNNTFKRYFFRLIFFYKMCL
jgi:hypothetical protein